MSICLQIYNTFDLSPLSVFYSDIGGKSLQCRKKMPNKYYFGGLCKLCRIYLYPRSNQMDCYIYSHSRSRSLQPHTTHKR